MPTGDLSAAHAKPSATNGPLLAIAPKPSHLDFASGPFAGFQGPQSAASANGAPPSWSPASGSFGNNGISPDRATLLSPQEQGADGQLSFPRGINSGFGHPGRPFGDGTADAQAASAHLDAAASNVDGLPAPSFTDADIIIPRVAGEADDQYWFSDDDDPYDYDEAMEDSEDEAYLGSQTAHLEANDLGILVKRRLDGQMDDSGTHMRTFSNFATQNVLASYFPSSSNSPLNDTRTASIFWYFVNVTGPTMSIFERHPVNPSPMFEGRPVAKSSQHTWTCTWWPSPPPRQKY